LISAGLALAHPAAAADATNPAPTEKDYAALGRLPDFSGVWTPDVTDQGRQIGSNPAPWIASAAQDIAHMKAEEAAGRPFPVLMGCLPYGMPALMMIPHNAMEILFTPGRITILGESDGN